MRRPERIQRSGDDNAGRTGQESQCLQFPTSLGTNGGQLSPSQPNLGKALIFRKKQRVDILEKWMSGGEKDNLV